MKNNEKSSLCLKKPDLSLNKDVSPKKEEQSGYYGWLGVKCICEYMKE